MDKELGRYKKKVADQQKLIKQLQAENQELVDEVKTTRLSMDCILAAIATQHGREETEDGEILGWSLRIRVLDMLGMFKTYQVQARKDGEDIVIGVCKRETM